MSVCVEFRQRDLRTARRLAAERNQRYEDMPDWDNHERTWGVDPEERNVIGDLGEMAFAEYAGLTINNSIVGMSDVGYDFHARIDGEPLYIDVKTAQKEPKCLMVKEYAVNADYYVLGHLHGNEVTLYGGATRESVLNDVPKESYRFEHTNYTLGSTTWSRYPNRRTLSA